ncbi:MAG: class I SAM-dependent methyltransferase [Anaerolineae bacterium]
MGRAQLFEIEDQPWCPKAIRDAATDYLQVSQRIANPYAPVVERLRAVVARSGGQVVDLCSGGAGPWPSLLTAFAETDTGVRVTLTDKYPNIPAFEAAQAAFPDAITYIAAPVDAVDVPPALNGVRTLFAALHHFTPPQARAILADAVRQRRSIVVCEATENKTGPILVMLLTPIIALLVTPWIRPFRWSRLVWTYPLPAVPLVLLFDGIVSCLRTYSPDELRALTHDLDDDYTWEIGQARSTRSLIPVTYLIGTPRPE